MRSKKRSPLAILFALSVIAGCGGEVRQSQQQSVPIEEKHDPVTIRIAIAPNHMSDEEFGRYIVDPVKKRYPWITVERELYGTGRSLTQLVAAGQTPDLVWQTNINMSEFRSLGLDYPLTELIRKHSFDASRIEQEALDAVKAASGRQELVAIPYTRHFSAMFYNKDIFDRFGVAYPTDGMTWEQVYELAKRVTRLEGGVQIRGLESNVTERPASQLSIPFIDSKTLKAGLQTDSWKKVMELVTKIHRIPGNEQIAYNSAADKLFVGGTLAMEPTINILHEANFKDYPDLKWDMVSYPTWPEAPDLGMRTDAHMLALSRDSKFKDDAFRVMTLLVSDEVQEQIALNGRLPIVKDPGIRNKFGKNLPFLQGKNIQAVYRTKPAPSFVPTEYDAVASAAINTALAEIIQKGTDINTALRQADEKVNNQIAAKEAAKKK